MMLAGVTVTDSAVGILARSARLVGADKLGRRLERALEDHVALLALTVERSVILSTLDDPPAGLAELRDVLMNEHRWREVHRL
jgi:hypothetical protein